MSIGPLLQTLAAQSRGQIIVCHQVPHSVLMTQKLNRVRLSDAVESALFCSELKFAQANARDYNPNHPIPVEPGSVFGILNSGAIYHSNIVVEISGGNITVAEQPLLAREIRFRPLERSFAEWKQESDRVVVFPPETAAVVLDRVSAAIEQEETRMGMEAWTRYRTSFNDEAARNADDYDAVIQLVLRRKDL